CIQALQLPYSF
nr:immunoglobulin light chain junction region [Macaca mulatta]